MFLVQKILDSWNPPPFFLGLSPKFYQFFLASFLITCPRPCANLPCVISPVMICSAPKSTFQFKLNQKLTNSIQNMFQRHLDPFWSFSKAGDWRPFKNRLFRMFLFYLCAVFESNYHSTPPWTPGTSSKLAVKSCL